METSAATVENRVATPQKLEQRVTRWPSRSTPVLAPRRMEKGYLYRSV